MDRRAHREAADPHPGRRAAHHRRRQLLPRHPGVRLHGVPRGRRQRPRQPARRCQRLPGGPWVRRRAHPPHGLRVPRRHGPLRQALGPLRRPVRPRRLHRPHHHRRLRRRPRGGALGQAEPRPGRLADVRGLAGTGLADPRGHLLPLDGARLARRPAHLRQPAGREQPAVPALPAEAELLRRHGLRAPAGRPDLRLPGLRRRPVRRPRQGLLPHRHQPLRGPRGHQRRQDGGDPRHRDLRAVRLHLQERAARRRRPGVRRGGDRHPDRRDARPRRASDGDRQQVRQRAVGHRRGRWRDRGAGQQRQLPRDRHLLGHAALRTGGRRERRQDAVRRPGHLRRPAGRALRGHRDAVGDAGAARAAALPDAAALQQPRPHHAR